MSIDFPNISLPNCVPEYFREQQEKYESECELHFQRLEHYEANQKKMDDAAEKGLPIIPYDGYTACQNCKDADFDTMTWEEDDIGNVICHNPECPEHKRHIDK